MRGRQLIEVLRRITACWLTASGATRKRARVHRLTTESHKDGTSAKHRRWHVVMPVIVTPETPIHNHRFSLNADSLFRFRFFCLVSFLSPNSSLSALSLCLTSHGSFARRGGTVGLTTSFVGTEVHWPGALGTAWDVGKMFPGEERGGQ